MLRDDQHALNFSQPLTVNRNERDAKFFIVGTQKSGTTWLRDCLNEFVNFCKPEWYYPELFENAARHVETFGASRPPEQRKRAIDKICLETWKALNEGFRGEKSAYPCTSALGAGRPEHSDAVSRMRERLPNARIAVIVRDPRAVFNSLRHYLDHFRGGWSQEIDPQDFAENWSRQNVRWVRDRPDALVLYEDLKQQFVPTLTRTLTGLGIPFTPEGIAQAENAVYSVSKLRPKQPEIYRTGTVDEWRTRLDPNIAQRIFEVAAPAMAEIGYRLSE